MLHSFFVYTPTTGSTVLGKPGVVCPTIEWNNGSLHCIAGVHLQYNVARQGAWWRDSGDQVAREIATACGGLAVERQGIADLFLPARAGYRADQMMRLVRKTSQKLGKFFETQGIFQEEDEANLVRLVQAGYRLTPSLSGVLQAENSPPKEPVFERFEVAKVEGKTLVSCCFTGLEPPIQIKAPGDWIVRQSWPTAPVDGPSETEVEPAL